MRNIVQNFLLSPLFKFHHNTTLIYGLLKLMSINPQGYGEKVFKEPKLHSTLNFRDFKFFLKKFRWQDAGHFSEKFLPEFCWIKIFSKVSIAVSSVNWFFNSLWSFLLKHTQKLLEYQLKWFLIFIIFLLFSLCKRRRRYQKAFKN